MADQAAFRIDFNDWLRKLSRRDRRIIARLARGERACAVAERFGLSQGRISQIRRAFAENWNRFLGDDPPAEPAARASA